MQKLEYKTADRSEWSPGPWDAEPDKIQWQDEATGLPCLIVRNYAGALCGYVGVSKGHPLFGVEYSECPLEEKCDGYCDHQPQSQLSVHGGLTFSSFCAAHKEEDWQRWRTRMLSADVQDSAVQYPSGDSARRLREMGHLIDDYPAFVKYMESRAICHLVEPGEDDCVWWFGFDCHHYRDSVPRRDYCGFDDGVYRDVSYVQSECADLARQLKGSTNG